MHCTHASKFLVPYSRDEAGQKADSPVEGVHLSFAHGEHGSLTVRIARNIATTRKAAHGSCSWRPGLGAGATAVSTRENHSWAKLTQQCVFCTGYCSLKGRDELWLTGKEVSQSPGASILLLLGSSL